MANVDVGKEARDYAHRLAEQHVPTGTRPHDEVFMSRQALENLLAKAYGDGIVGDPDPGA